MYLYPCLGVPERFPSVIMNIKSLDSKMDTQHAIGPIDPNPHFSYRLKEGVISCNFRG